MPAGPGVRVDAAIEAGERVPPDYDPLIAKVMADGRDRPEALARLARALDEIEISGIQTTLPFDRALVRNPRFAEGDLSTDWVANEWDGQAARARAIEVAARVAAAAEVGPGARTGAGEATGIAEPDRRDRRAQNATPAGWLAAARAEAVDRWPS